MARRTVSMMVAAMLLLVLAGGVALAKNINGTAKNDTLYGTSEEDRISGRAGNDYIDGQGDADELIGGAGRDRLWGGPGNDTAFGLAGNDSLIGEFGDDRVLGGEGDDQLVGDEMIGGGGEDRIGDAIWGQPISGTLLASGGDGNDTINVLEHHFDVYDGISTPDTVECGAGDEDKVWANSDDTVADDCEIVEIVEQ